MIGILNYGVGNVKAFQNIYNDLHIENCLVSKKSDLKSITKLILPGVGHFDFALKKFKKLNLTNEIERMIFDEKIPILGVCVGLQMMCKRSEEGNEEGLGWIDDVVVKFDENIINGKPKTPQMGWNEITIINEDKIFKGFPEKANFYFLHSFHLKAIDPLNSLSTTNYGYEFTSVIKNNNIYGMQCHPEKSHKYGIQFLKNFAEL